MYACMSLGSAFFKICHNGYMDALRALHPSGVHYTYWDYQAGAWQRVNGVRIDHLLLSPEAGDRLVGVGIDKGPRGLERPSDHTPIWCERIEGWMEAGACKHLRDIMQLIIDVK